MDATGRIVKLIHKSNFQIGKNIITMDLSDVTSGIYFCEVKSNGNLQTYQLIKN
ncbi:MAG: T9SS type A sorting domain-containing protein [Bacteroidetes bacterium]|nr:T9SS type A sorting domain-containing protein [Bacteroidota bacterium]